MVRNEVAAGPGRVTSPGSRIGHPSSNPATLASGDGAGPDIPRSTAIVPSPWHTTATSIGASASTRWIVFATARPSICSASETTTQPSPNREASSVGRDGGAVGLVIGRVGVDTLGLGRGPAVPEGVGLVIAGCVGVSIGGGDPQPSRARDRTTPRGRARVDISILAARARRRSRGIRGRMVAYATTYGPLTPARGGTEPWTHRISGC